MTFLSALHDFSTSRNAVLTSRDGFTAVSRYRSLEDEYRTIRETVGLTDFSHFQKFCFRGEEALYFLDEILPANIANIRYGRVIHTFLADDDGHVLSDVYVANQDDTIWMVCESCVETAVIEQRLATANTKQITYECLTDSYAAFSIDGPQAWAVAREMFGPDVLGMPYLSVELHDENGDGIVLLRTGKTSEFGYLMLVPVTQCRNVYDRLLTLTEKHSGGACGIDVFDILKLDGRFFNINQEGRIVRDPLTLGLQWMIDFQKDAYHGKTAIDARRETGLKRKIIGLKSLEQGTPMARDTRIVSGEETVAEVITAGFSQALDTQMALALFDIRYAYSGLDFIARTATGNVKVQTVSLPPFIPRSLTIKLDEM